MSDNPTLTSDEIKTIKDFLNLAHAFTSSLTSSQIANRASDLGEILSILQSLNNDDFYSFLKTLATSAGSLAEIVSLLETYHKSGTLKNALELLSLLGAVKNALSSQTVAGWAEKVNDLIFAGDRLVTEAGGFGGVERILKSARKASQQAAQDSSAVGLMGLLKALKEPEVQDGIKFLLYFIKNIKK